MALAIDGGTPVRSRLLPYGRQSVDDSDIQAVVDVLRSDWLTTGPMIDTFETAFAQAVGARYAVAVANGTAALHAAAYAVGLKAGDTAIVPPMTFAATANCILYQSAKPVFVDVRRDTLNLDSALTQTAITDSTRAIFTVDFTGQPSDLSELMRIAQQRRIPLIEDASHALGATYAGCKVGSMATLTTFSLHPVKHVTTGEGGVITTNDPRLAERLRVFRNHGITSDHHARQRQGSWVYEMVDLGYNYRLTDFQCALGLSQLRKLPGWLARRREIATRYATCLADLPEVELPHVLPDRESAWHLFVIRLHLEQLRVGRREAFQALRAENIGVNVHYIPVPWHPYYQQLGYTRGLWPVAEAEYERMISLPMFPAMTDADVDDVVEAVHKVVSHYRR